MTDWKEKNQLFGQPFSMVRNNSSKPSDHSLPVAAVCRPMTRRHSLASSMGLAYRINRSNSVAVDSRPLMAIASPELKKKATLERARSAVQKIRPCSPKAKDREEHGIVMLGVGGVGKTGNSMIHCYDIRSISLLQVDTRGLYKLSCYSRLH